MSNNIGITGGCWKAFSCRPILFNAAPAELPIKRIKTFVTCVDSCWPSRYAANIHARPLLTDQKKKKERESTGHTRHLSFVCRSSLFIFFSSPRRNARYCIPRAGSVGLSEYDAERPPFISRDRRRGKEEASRHRGDTTEWGDEKKSYDARDERMENRKQPPFTRSLHPPRPSPPPPP